MLFTSEIAICNSLFVIKFTLGMGS
ncbi:DUF3149 domain-containing protein [Paraglaciecola mesophila]